MTLLNTLWTRLALAFALVTVMGLLIAGLVTNIRVSTEFRRFVHHNQMLDSMLVPGLVSHYTAHGSWAGVDTVLDRPRGGGMGIGRGQGMGMSLLLADANGQVIYAHGVAIAQLTRQQQTDALPITVDGQTVGYLWSDTPHNTDLAPSAQEFLGQLNAALLQAGLIAGGLGLLFGMVIARGLSAPLRRLATAAQRIAQGNLNQHVPVQGATEVAGLAQSFNEMAAGLARAETLRRHLVADVAHELRTPLSVIQGNLRAILDEVYPLERREIAAIYDETLMLSRLVSDLRELAQAEAGQLQLHRRPVSLDALVESAVNLFAELAQEKGITLIHTPASSDLPPVLADPDRVRQVIHNLLTNALRHTPTGGEIRLAVTQRGDAACLLVSDTGSGIAADDLPHVFERFWRADRSRARESGGSGLGLVISKQLIEAHGGRIGAASEPERGSRFWVMLPLYQPVQAKHSLA